MATTDVEHTTVTIHDEPTRCVVSQVIWGHASAAMNEGPRAGAAAWFDDAVTSTHGTRSTGRSWATKMMMIRSMRSPRSSICLTRRGLLLSGSGPLMLVTWSSFRSTSRRWRNTLRAASWDRGERGILEAPPHAAGVAGRVPRRSEPVAGRARRDGGGVMATITASHPTVTVPEKYLGDVREAIAEVIGADTNAIEEYARMRDLDSLELRARMLARARQMQKEVDAASGGIELTADHDKLSHPVSEMLGFMVRDLVERLAKEFGYEPVEVDDEVLDLVARLQWAAVQIGLLEGSEKIERGDED